MAFNDYTFLLNKLKYLNTNKRFKKLSTKIFTIENILNKINVKASKYASLLQVKNTFSPKIKIKKIVCDIYAPSPKNNIIILEPPL